MKAIIPAGGMGTRCLPATKTVAKEMLPLGDRPLLHYMIEELKEAGVEETVVVVSPGKKNIQDYFREDKGLEEVLKKKKAKDLLKEVRDIQKLKVDFAVQKKPKGDGDALLKAKRKVGKESFVVCFGDTLFEEGKKVWKEMIKLHKKTGKVVVAVKQVPKEEVSKFGIVKGKNERNRMRVVEVVEKPSVKEAPSRWALVGAYVLTPEIWRRIKRAEPSKGGELRLSDALKDLMKDDAIYAYKVKGEWLDTGNFLGYFRANVMLNKKHPRFGREVKKVIQEVARKK